MAFCSPKALHEMLLFPMLPFSCQFLWLLETCEISLPQLRGFLWHSRRWDIFSVSSGMTWGFFQGGSFWCREFVKRDLPCWEGAGIGNCWLLCSNIFSFQEVVVVSVSHNMGLQALVWGCPVLHLSTSSAGVAGSVTAWCCECDGEAPDLQVMGILGGGADWLQHLSALLGRSLLWSCLLLCSQHIMIVFSSLLQQLLVGQELEQMRSDNGWGR